MNLFKLEKMQTMLIDKITSIYRIIFDYLNGLKKTSLFYEKNLPFSATFCKSFLDQISNVVQWKLFRLYISLEIRENGLNSCIVNYKIETTGWIGMLSMTLFRNKLETKILQHSRKLILYLNLNQQNTILDSIGFDHITNEGLYKRYAILNQNRFNFYEFWPKLFWSLLNKTNIRQSFRRRRVLILPVNLKSEEMQDWFPPPLHYADDMHSYLEIALEASHKYDLTKIYNKGNEAYISIRVFVPIFLVADDFSKKAYSCIHEFRIKIFPHIFTSLFTKTTASWNLHSDQFRLTIGDRLRRLQTGISFYARAPFSSTDTLPNFIKSPRIQVNLHNNTFDLNILEQNIEFPVNRITTMSVKNLSPVNFFSWLSSQIKLQIQQNNSPAYLISYIDEITLSSKKYDLAEFQYRKVPAHTGINGCS